MHEFIGIGWNHNRIGPKNFVYQAICIVASQLSWRRQDSTTTNLPLQQRCQILLTHGVAFRVAAADSLRTGRMILDGLAGE